MLYGNPIHSLFFFRIRCIATNFIESLSLRKKTQNNSLLLPISHFLCFTYQNSSIAVLFSHLHHLFIIFHELDIYCIQKEKVHHRKSRFLVLIEEKVTHKISTLREPISSKPFLVTLRDDADFFVSKVFVLMLAANDGKID